MVKHQKEKLYQSAREHRSNSQIRAGTSSSSSSVRNLPFNCCALSLTPFQNPVCTPDGIIFESDAILPYILKYKKDPVTGKSMSTRDLITLNMDKNQETGAWQCPVLCKTFSDYSKVVAVRQRNEGSNTSNEANVYAYEAVEELNFKTKNYVDLISGKKFSKSADVIILLDPNNDDLTKLRDINNFIHTKMLRDKEKKKDKDTLLISERDNNIRHSVTATRIMEKLAQDKNKRKKREEAEKTKKRKNTETEKEKLKILTEDVVTGFKMSSGVCSGSFTSTSMEISHSNESREATLEELLNARFQLMKRMKKKGYARLVTNLGEMEIELHCDIVPRTTSNFLGLAEAGKYDGSLFHRSIRNFMIQGGKPRKKGVSEESYWGKEPFSDEFDDRLTHSRKGVLSMANSGANTNRCQFFLTYKSCNHLDRKHSVFGTVINGLDVLTSMENIPTHKQTDKPLQKIQINSIVILANPAKEAEEAERIRIETRIAEREKKKANRKAAVLGTNMVNGTKPNIRPTKEIKSLNKENKIGIYLPKNVIQKLEDNATNLTNQVISQEKNMTRLPPPPKETTFGNFNNW